MTQAMRGIPSGITVATSENTLECRVIQLLFSQIWPKPPAASNVPSVTMMGSIPNAVLTTPLMSPTRSAASMPTRMARPTGQPWFTLRLAMTTELSRTLEPTERSMPPVSITAVSPMETTPITATCSKMLRMLLTVAKGPEVRANTPKMTMAMRTMPKRAACSVVVVPSLGAPGPTRTGESTAIFVAPLAQSLHREEQ